MMFILFWNDVYIVFYAMCLQTNSYQVIFVSNSNLSFVFFSYGDIQWSDTNTFVGFNLQDRHFSLPGSQTPAVLDLETCSNVGVPGLFVYGVYQLNIIDPSRSQSGECNYFTTHFREGKWGRRVEKLEFLCITWILW